MIIQQLALFHQLFETFNHINYFRKLKGHNYKFEEIFLPNTKNFIKDLCSKFYNKEIKLPTKYKHEKLYRNDNTYDIIAVLNYNTNPIIKNKGSAIFIHIAKKKYKKTKGCIALKKKHLIHILSSIKKNTKININKN